MCAHLGGILCQYANMYGLKMPNFLIKILACKLFIHLKI